MVTEVTGPYETSTSYGEWKANRPHPHGGYPGGEGPPTTFRKVQKGPVK
jgi:hypothetical protein